MSEYTVSERHSFQCLRHLHNPPVHKRFMHFQKEFPMCRKCLANILLIIICSILIIVPGCTEVPDEIIQSPTSMPSLSTPATPTVSINSGEDCYSLFLNGKMLTLAFAEPFPKEIAEKIFSEYSSLSCELNTSDETGAFFAFNNSEDTSLPLTALQADILREGLLACHLTDGAFDITDEPLRALWDFSGEFFTPPTEEAISAALERINYQRIVVEGDTLLTESADIQLNTSYYFDGYAINRALLVLAEQKIASAELTFGNVTYFLGQSAEDTPYRLTLSVPEGEASVTIGSVELTDMAFTALHCMDQYQETADGRIHPLFDLHTGYPSESGFTSVFVFSGSPILAQTMARACYSLTVEHGKTLVSNLENTHILWVMDDGSFQFSDGFTDRLDFEEAK